MYKIDTDHFFLFSKNLAFRCGMSKKKNLIKKGVFRCIFSWKTRSEIAISSMALRPRHLGTYKEYMYYKHGIYICIVYVHSVQRNGQWDSSIFFLNQIQQNRAVPSHTVPWDSRLACRLYFHADLASKLSDFMCVPSGPGHKLSTPNHLVQHRLAPLMFNIVRGDASGRKTIYSPLPVSHSSIVRPVSPLVS